MEDWMIEPASAITRREALRRVSALMGGITLVATDRLELLAFEPAALDQTMAGGVGLFTAGDVALLDEIAETILPETTTPGAKAAKTGAFMALIVTDSYSLRDQKVFRDGMQKLEAASVKANGTGFMKSTPEQRLALLETLDKEQKAEADVRKQEALKKTQALIAQPAPVGDAPVATPITAEPAVHYFRMMKELALLGFFTSEIGCTQAQRYVESPGRFDPCVPYTPGEKAWAPHA